MLTKITLPLASAALLAFAVYHVATNEVQNEVTAPPIEPSRSPYAATIAAAGIIEARTENISIGSSVPGVAVEVFVKVGQRVAQNDKLFRLDDRHWQAERRVRSAELDSARAGLARLENQPRPEEVPILEARIAKAEADLAMREDQLARNENLFARDVGSEEELVNLRQRHLIAKAQLEQDRAELALLAAGAWEPDLAIARSAVAEAQARLELVETELERLVIRAPVAGEVLQLNVRPGEFVGAPPTETLLLLGDVQRLRVRAEIDEHDIPRFRPGTPARAVLKGDPAASFPLSFVHVEKYVVPKRALTGRNQERIDTRVLLVVYELDSASDGLFYVGQQVDVYIDAADPIPSHGEPPISEALP